MNIGISTSVVQRGRSGVGQYLLSLVRALASECQGHHFSLFVLEDDLPLFDSVNGQMDLVAVPEIFRPAVRNILWHHSLLPKLARAMGLDVLHVPSYRRLIWARPCRMVATIHDLAPFHVRDKYDWKRMLYGRVVARRLARRSDCIIAVSRHTAGDIVQHFRLPGKRVVPIYNGLDHHRFCQGSAAEARRGVAQTFGLDRPFFLYTARLEHPGKNHVRLIAAFNTFKAQTRSDWLLALAGSDWSGAEAVHCATESSPFKSDIRRLGFVSDSALPELYRAAGTFVYPSLYEGFGLPPLEAMACGCPVISSTRGALAEVLGPSALVVEPEDTASIAGQLVSVAGDAALRERLAAAGLLQAKKFDWRITAARTLQVYEGDTTGTFSVGE